MTVELSSASDTDTNIFWIVTPYRYGFLTDDQTLTYADPVNAAAFSLTGSDLPSGTLVIPAGQTSATFTINGTVQAMPYSQNYWAGETINIQADMQADWLFSQWKTYNNTILPLSLIHI